MELLRRKITQFSIGQDNTFDGDEWTQWFIHKSIESDQQVVKAAKFSSISHFFSQQRSSSSCFWAHQEYFCLAFVQSPPPAWTGKTLIQAGFCGNFIYLDRLKAKADLITSFIVFSIWCWRLRKRIPISMHEETVTLSWSTRTQHKTDNWTTELIVLSLCPPFLIGSENLVTLLTLPGFRHIWNFVIIHLIHGASAKYAQEWGIVRTHYIFREFKQWWCLNSLQTEIERYKFHFVRW
jgi:hypothetical protein